MRAWVCLGSTSSACSACACEPAPVPQEASCGCSHGSLCQIAPKPVLIFMQDYSARLLR